MKPEKIKFITSVCTLILSLLVTGLIFILTYYADNKYTTKNSTIYTLTDNWEYYCGKLFEPADFANKSVDVPAEHIFIGQFGTFSDTKHSSPFGTATYRKRLILPEITGNWLLELPEVFSASRVYVNGKLLREYGTLSKSNYRIHTQNTLISLPSGEVELLILTANYSHYYSGMTYPPVLGRSDEVTHVVIQRLLFYALLCFFSFGCAVISVTTWLRRRKSPLYAAYGFLCLFFSIHTFYPFAHWLGLNIGELTYVVEDMAYFLMLLCMVVLTYCLAKDALPRWLHMLFYGYCAVLVILPPLAVYFVFPEYPSFIFTYGTIMLVSKVIISTYLILAALIGSVLALAPYWLLSGNTIFGLGILTDYLTAGKFEPLRFGWQTEYCGFIMVILFTLLILRHNYRIIHEHEHLTAHLQDEVARKTDYLSALLKERKKLVAAVAHDLKAPAAVIHTYIDFIRDSETAMDPELKEYLAVIDRKSAQIQDNVLGLQQVNSEDYGEGTCVSLDCNAFLQSVYTETLPYADANGIYYHLELPPSSVKIYGCMTTLYRVFENIILNASEHTPENGTITLKASYTNVQAVITVTDTGEGITPLQMPHIFEYQFSTKTTQLVRGLGLYFSKLALEEYGGGITAQSIPGVYTTFTVTLPISMSFDKVL